MGGWTASIITLGKRLEDGNGLRETERERQIQEVFNKGKPRVIWKWPLWSSEGSNQSQPYPHIGPEYYLPSPMPSPIQGPSPSVYSVPKPRLFKGTIVGRPLFLAPGAPVSAIVIGKELDQHPIPTPSCHLVLAFVFPHPQSPLLTETTPYLF